MVDPVEQKDDTSAKIWGMPVNSVVFLLQNVGVPTLLLAMLLYAGWCWIPPIVNGHVRLLDKTGQTLDSMDETLKQSNVILSEVSTMGKESDKNQREVRDVQREVRDVQNKVLDNQIKTMENQGRTMENQGKMIESQTQLMQSHMGAQKKLDAILNAEKKKGPP